MTRSTTLAVAATFALLAGCGGTDAGGSGATDHNQTVLSDNAVIEDVPADGMAAPSDLPTDSESNGVGSASGGNAI